MGETEAWWCACTGKHDFDAAGSSFLARWAAIVVGLLDYQAPVFHRGAMPGSSCLHKPCSPPNNQKGTDFARIVFPPITPSPTVAAASPARPSQPWPLHKPPPRPCPAPLAHA